MPGSAWEGFALYRWIDDGARLRVLEARSSAAPSQSAEQPTEPSPPPEPAAAAPPPPPACTCPRADSPLWASAIPALVACSFRSRRRTRNKTAPTIAPFLTKRGASRYAFDVVVVNNASVPLKDVTSSSRSRVGTRRANVGATDRGLFSANLRPGRSMKWSVSGPGTEYKVEVSEKRVIGTQSSPPPPHRSRRCSARSRRP
ncbi:MAG: hypothetical protein U0414_28265 [Polyangiaceae bacterium]